MDMGFFPELKDNDIGEKGVILLSEALKSNTTLIELNLGREDKRKKTHKDIHQQIALIFLLISTDTKIGDTGATSLSEALKSNTTLTKLNLRGEDKRKTQKTSINNSLFSFLFDSTGNKFGNTGATSLSDALKSNTSLAELNLFGKDKRTHKKEIHQKKTLHFSSHEQ